MDAEFKYNIILEILKKYPKIYIHVMPHENLIIGNRGLVGDENQHGILLVFGRFSYKNLGFSDDNLFVDMKFSGIWEDLSIPLESIYAIFDSTTDPEFIFNFKIESINSKSSSDKKKKPVKKGVVKDDGKIIKVDFKKV